MFSAWGDTTEDDEASKEEEAVVALMARSKLDSNDEPLNSIARLKEQAQVRGNNPGNSPENSPANS